MKSEKNSKVSFQSVTRTIAGNMAEVAPRACLTLALAVMAAASTNVLAGGAMQKGEHLGGYTLVDDSMLGRYGDVNDEWVASTAPTTTGVSREPMTAANKPQAKKKDSRLGAYSMEDNAMLGRYGDMNDE